MTDRVHSLTVVLEADVRDDDIQPVINAIRMIKCVIDVRPEVANITTHMAEKRARMDLQKQLWDVLNG